MKQAIQRGGQPLDKDTRNFLEPRFGQSFENVRVHADGEADQLSSGFGARAFATGSNIFFRAEEYRPETEGGKFVLAHELTHVVQNERFGASENWKRSKPSDSSELEASSVARSVLKQPNLATNISSRPSSQISLLAGAETNTDQSQHENRIPELSVTEVNQAATYEQAAHNSAYALTDENGN